MKKILLVLVLCLFGLSACKNDGGNSNSSSSSNRDKTSISSSISTTADTETIEPKYSKMIVDSLEQGFGEFNTIEQQGETNKFRLIPKEGAAETETLNKIAQDPNGEGHEQTLMNSASGLFEFTTTVEESIGQPIEVSLANPQDKSKNLFTVSSGKITTSIYDK